jgi:LmbE family N-acetylglucosaminyl deacetylase
MLGVTLNKQQDDVLKILCLGAHSDDIEIGCGGTILKLIQDFPNSEFHWIVFGSSESRATEARDSAHVFLKEVKEKQIIVKGYRDGFFPYIGGAIKDYFEQLKGEISPDMIFTHYRDDLHQDHRLLCELTWNTFRDHLILEYEVPKYDGDLGSPNFFVLSRGDIGSPKIPSFRCSGCEALSRRHPASTLRHSIVASWFSGNRFATAKIYCLETL